MEGLVPDNFGREALRVGSNQCLDVSHFSSGSFEFDSARREIGNQGSSIWSNNEGWTYRGVLTWGRVGQRVKADNVDVLVQIHCSKSRGFEPKNRKLNTFL